MRTLLLALSGLDDREDLEEEGGTFHDWNSIPESFVAEDLLARSGMPTRKIEEVVWDLYQAARMGMKYVFILMLMAELLMGHHQQLPITSTRS